jgi:hypothetical protein
MKSRSTYNNGLGFIRQRKWRQCHSRKGNSKRKQRSRSTAIFGRDLAGEMAGNGEMKLEKQVAAGLGK